MHKLFMFCLALLISFARVQAQEGYPQSKSSQPPAQQQSNSGQPSMPGQYGTSNGYPQSDSAQPRDTELTVQGCLQVAGTNYSLLADDGKTYQLNGHSAELHEHVGHEVQITGKSSVKTVDTTLSGAASSAKELGAIKVHSVKHISQTCQAVAR